jgi:hypothetical protein
MADLDEEIEVTTCAYVGAAVTEIATLRLVYRASASARPARPEMPSLR